MEPLIKSAMSRVAIKNERIARRTMQVVVILQRQGVQRRRRPFLMQPLPNNLWGTAVLRAVCGVRLLVKGMVINFHPLPNPLTEGEGAIALSPSGGKLEKGLAFLASHPAKP